ncbi:CopD family protein [Thauera sp. WH-1]|uniref:CopD family protein n=1 Tax=Thauera sp. WH-1 TaxID=3398230 RepID=UPI0039FC7A9C
MIIHPFLLFLHITGVAVWVGGMFFAYVCLRPEAASQLEPAPRLRLWRGVLARFFSWVWVAVAAVLASGLALILRLGFAAAPLYQHLMLLMGLVMIAIYVYVFFVPYAALGKAVAAENWKAGGAALGRIRQLVGTNLTLGFLTIAMGTLGRWLG